MFDWSWIKLDLAWNLSSLTWSPPPPFPPWFPPCVSNFFVVAFHYVVSISMPNYHGYHSCKVYLDEELINFDATFPNRGLKTYILMLQNLVCCAADVLEGRGLVQVAITVAELMRFHTPRSPAHSLNNVWSMYWVFVQNHLIGFIYLRYYYLTILFNLFQVVLHVPLHTWFNNIFTGLCPIVVWAVSVLVSFAHIHFPPIFFYVFEKASFSLMRKLQCDWWFKEWVLGFGSFSQLRIVNCIQPAVSKFYCRNNIGILNLLLDFSHENYIFIVPYFRLQNVHSCMQ